MPKDKLTESTRGPIRRPLTILALGAAVVALVMTIAMVLAAFGALPQSSIRALVLIWILSLMIVFGVTRYLRSDR